jgi:phosphinothricin acetyltransferase
VEIIEALPHHAAEIAAIYAPAVTASTISFEEVPPGADEMGRRMEANRPWLVALVDGSVAGYAYASPFKDRAAYRHTVETTVYVASDHRGRRVATALVGDLLDRLRDGGAHTAVAVIALPNPASVATAESLGFAHAGTIPEAGFKSGSWIDVGLWVRQV